MFLLGLVLDSLTCDDSKKAVVTMSDIKEETEEDESLKGNVRVKLEEMQDAWSDEDGEGSIDSDDLEENTGMVCKEEDDEE